MNKLIFALGIIFLAVSGKSQNSHIPIDVCDVTKEFYKSKDTSVLNQYLDHPENFSENHIKILESEKILFLLSQYQRAKKNNQRMSNENLEHIDQLFDKLENNIASLNNSDQIFLIEKRYLLLDDLKYDEKVRDRQKLIERGYKEEIRSLSIAPVINYNGNFGFGAEITLFKFYQPKYTLRSDAGSYSSKRAPDHFSGLTIGGIYYTGGKHLDYSFSLLNGSIGYINVNPTQLIYTFYNDEGGLGYRPEIGFSLEKLTL